MLEALRKMCLNNVGFELQDESLLSADLSELTKETFYEVVFAVSPSGRAKFEKMLEALYPKSASSYRLIGWTIPEKLKWGSQFEIPCAELTLKHKNSWVKNLGLK